MGRRTTLQIEFFTDTNQYTSNSADEEKVGEASWCGSRNWYLECAVLRLLDDGGGGKER